MPRKNDTYRVDTRITTREERPQLSGGADDAVGDVGPVFL
jgi:hypothetical protein